MDTICKQKKRLLPPVIYIFTRGITCKAHCAWHIDSIVTKTLHPCWTKCSLLFVWFIHELVSAFFLIKIVIYRLSTMPGAAGSLRPSLIQIGWRRPPAKSLAIPRDIPVNNSCCLGYQSLPRIPCQISPARNVPYVKSVQLVPVEWGCVTNHVHILARMFPLGSFIKQIFTCLTGKISRSRDYTLIRMFAIACPY